MVESASRLWQPALILPGTIQFMVVGYYCVTDWEDVVNLAI